MLIFNIRLSVVWMLPTFKLTALQWNISPMAKCEILLRKVKSSLRSGEIFRRGRKVKVEICWSKFHFYWNILKLTALPASGRALFMSANSKKSINNWYLNNYLIIAFCPNVWYNILTPVKNLSRRNKMQLNLGIKIRELRRRDGRTQDNLAESLGVTAQAVSRWEAGISQT